MQDNILYGASSDDLQELDQELDFSTYARDVMPILSEQDWDSLIWSSSR